MTSDLFDLGSDTPPTKTTSQKNTPLSQQAVKQIRPESNEALTNNINHMNPEQRQAVLSEDGPLLILAGAGTGKTRVLTSRIAHKISTTGVYPSQFLAVTFTNKAAKEMKNRIAQMITHQAGDIEKMPWLGTFHSISAKILRRHAESVNLKPDFTILDMDDQNRLLKQLIKDENIDDKRWPPRMLAAIIDNWKNNALHPHQLSAEDQNTFANGAGKKLYQKYQTRLKSLNAVDFGDILLESLRLLQENPNILEQYQNRFRHILVDEYQDTNTVQYLWLRLLAQSHRNICCVGDDDQSIYGWRGAQIDNILRFEKDFPGAKTIRLERNYRSTSHILATATSLIKSNQKRLGKKLWTEGNQGDKVLLHSAWDGQQEALHIAESIENKYRKKHKLNEISILVRASFQMREFEDVFITHAIPYKVIGGPKFYDRAEIRDANAYLRLIAQEDDDLAFERICNKPKRSLGNATLQKLHLIARQHNISLSKAARLHTEKKEVTKFIKMIDELRNMQTQYSSDKFVEYMLNKTGYMASWLESKLPDAPSKVDNLKELIRSIEGFETLQLYLEHVALVTDNEENENKDQVSLMTLHAAKGLEFETVFLPGWEEGLFPHQRSLDEAGIKGVEEERRLAYVGITRAKKYLSISFAGSRRIHGQYKQSLPSRFIDELPEEHIQIVENIVQNQSKIQMPLYENKKEQKKPTNTKLNSSSFKLKERIFHQKFGYGRILNISGNTLTIKFEKAGTKKLIDRFVEKIS